MKGVETEKKKNVFRVEPEGRGNLQDNPSITKTISPKTIATQSPRQLQEKDIDKT